MVGLVLMSDARVLTANLLPGERLIWTGSPARGVIFTARDFFLVPFSIIWCAFVIIWTVVASRAGAFALFGLLFLAFGLFFSVGRFALDAWLRAGTQYGLTDRRILILRLRPTNSFTAIDLGRLPQAQVSARGDGRGTIRFGAPASLFGGSGLSIWTPSLDPTPQFIGIPDVRKVFDQIQQTAAGQS